MTDTPEAQPDRPACRGRERASTLSDSGERRTFFDELHERPLEAVPRLILYNGVETWGASARVTGFSSWEGKPRLRGVGVAR